MVLDTTIRKDEDKQNKQHYYTSCKFPVLSLVNERVPI
jgi:hypothetical protein